MPIIEILKIGFCDKTSCNSMRCHRRVYCVDESSSSYNVHKNNRQYTHFLTEIQRTYQGIQPDYAKISAEAKAL